MRGPIKNETLLVNTKDGCQMHIESNAKALKRAFCITLQYALDPSVIPVSSYDTFFKGLLRQVR